jgi:hypothetical protein
MKQRKRMGLPTARIVVSPRLGAAELPDVRHAVAAAPDGLRTAELPAVRAAVAAAQDASFADNTITKLMERLDDGRRVETASHQRRPLPSAPATFQPKVLRTRASRA